MGLWKTGETCLRGEIASDGSDKGKTALLGRIEIA